ILGIGKGILRVFSLDFPLLGAPPIPVIYSIILTSDFPLLEAEVALIMVNKVKSQELKKQIHRKEVGDEDNNNNDKILVGNCMGFTHGFPTLLFPNLFNEFCMKTHEKMIF
ncbi:hypothetical protein L208DRAFT_1290104, partial [Tricholoma matsutake]